MVNLTWFPMPFPITTLAAFRWMEPMVTECNLSKRSDHLSQEEDQSGAQWQLTAQRYDIRYQGRCNLKTVGNGIWLDATPDNRVTGPSEQFVAAR